MFDWWGGGGFEGRPDNRYKFTWKNVIPDKSTLDKLFLVKSTLVKTSPGAPDSTLPVQKYVPTKLLSLGKQLYYDRKQKLQLFIINTFL